MNKKEIIMLVIIFTSFIIGLLVYPSMPVKMASHWNSAGQVGGYMSKLWGVFLMPILALGMFVVFLIIPHIDPLKKNIKKFKKYYDNFILFMIVFLFYINILSLFWNSGSRFDMGKAIIPAIAILFYFIGILVENVEPNWFIGIRTPWTLSSKKVWKKTHEKGATMFKGCAVISFIGVVAGTYAMWFVLVPVIATAVYLFVYSYLEYKKEKK